jgi:hypothetical protein
MPTRQNILRVNPSRIASRIKTPTARPSGTFDEVLIEVREKVLLPANVFLALLRVPG